MNTSRTQCSLLLCSIPKQSPSANHYSCLWITSEKYTTNIFDIDILVNILHHSIEAAAVGALAVCRVITQDLSDQHTHSAQCVAANSFANIYFRTVPLCCAHIHRAEITWTTNNLCSPVALPVIPQGTGFRSGSLLLRLIEVKSPVRKKWC